MKATIPTTYYSLLAMYDGLWSVQFGDYDKSVVRDEQRDWLDAEPETSTMIIRTRGDSQDVIDAAVAEWNKGLTRTYRDYEPVVPYDC